MGKYKSMNNPSYILVKTLLKMKLLFSKPYIRILK